MCGILGTIDLPLDEPTLDLIRHRGPDDHGIVEVTVGGHRVTLGHRRLAIVDLSEAGHQPMQTTCGRYSLVFNGEVYNHQELRRQLPDVPFRGHSDTETILNAMACQGTDAVARFNGIFALAFVDSVRGTLVLARDPFGVKPLYYWQGAGTFVFSSELKPMLRLVRATLDPASLAELLRLRYLPAPDTLFQGMKKVRPGHLVEIDLASGDLSTSEEPYAAVAPEYSHCEYGEALEEYGRLFESAVRRQLMSDVEVGVLLSGGVDSALVASIAQRHCHGRLKAFTVGFTDRDQADETEDARDTADRLGLEHRVTRIGFDDFLGSVRKCVSIVEEPLATTSLIPMHYLAELAASEVKVVLTGQGADEPLGGYGRYQGELYQRFLPSPLLRLAGPLASLVGVKNDRIVRGLSSLGERFDSERFLSVYSVFSDAEIRGLIGCHDRRSLARLRYFYDLLDCRRRRHSVESMMSIDLRMNLADDLLLYTDKVTMHHSLECRVPILDLELVRFVESLPAKYRVQLGRGKVIHKDYARSMLPESIVRRKKKGFQSPTTAWFRNGNGLREILLDKSSRFSCFFDLAEVEKVLRKHAGGHNRERHLFLLLAICCWMEEMFT
ncbi:MAG: asparagine synthase (glutamine-hydrolyzing) [Pirellulales bacterium]|nr:asparagine synthase (glutamine-hydrolyzing) [Pirellulales bacterium]